MTDVSYRLCSIEGCGREKWARGWCSKHYQQWRKKGDPLYVWSRPAKLPCRIEGCQELVRSRDLCERHYQHWWRYGFPTTLPPRPTVEICQVEGCDGKPRSRTAEWCEMHYMRHRRSGGFERVDTRLETPGYRSAHQRIAKDRGKARDHGCVDCGERAAHWSFAWRDVSSDLWLWELFNGTMLAYTGDSYDYEARCHKCARRYDRDFAMHGWRQQAKTRAEQMA